MSTNQPSMGWTPADSQVIEELRRSLKACGGDGIRKIILYGSRATGTALPGSDFDVLVVERSPVAKREERRRFREALRDFPHSVDVWVMDEEEFEETKAVIGGVAYPANKYGVRLE